MANDKQLEILRQGVIAWNNWREANPTLSPDLSNTDFRGVNFCNINLHNCCLVYTNFSHAQLKSADFSNSNLEGSSFSYADLTGVNISGCNLKNSNFNSAALIAVNASNTDFYNCNFHNASLTCSKFDSSILEKVSLNYGDLRWTSLIGVNLANAYLNMAILTEADLSNCEMSGVTAYSANFNKVKLINANLREANLGGSNLSGANLENADLSQANLRATRLIDTNLQNANFTNCYIHGISVWDLKLNEKTKQTNLVISKEDEPIITTDNIEIAQFLYLLLNNQKIRHIIDAITTKVVLILGRFTPNRKAILDSIREDLRRNDYIPVLFDFDKPSSKNTLETVVTLANLARFIIADITDPKSIPGELAAIVPHSPSLIVQPILEDGKEPWGMYDGIKCYPWVLRIHQYKDWNDLSRSFKDKILPCIEKRVKEIRKDL